MTYEVVPFTDVSFPPHGYEVKKGFIIFGEYNNKTPVIQIVDIDTGHQEMATINLHSQELRPSEGNTFIKDFDGNEGLWKVLHDLGVVSEPVREIPLNPPGTKVQECKITAPLRTEEDEDDEPDIHFPEVGEVSINGGHITLQTPTGPFTMMEGEALQVATGLMMCLNLQLNTPWSEDDPSTILTRGVRHGKGPEMDEV